MAKTKAKSTGKMAERKTHELPEGFEERSYELKGFLDPDGEFPVQFVPMSAKIIDSSIEPKKSSVLIVCRYVSGPATDSDQQTVTLKKGDMCGLWYKAGMKELDALAGAEVFMYCKGEKDTGKPNPMRVYRIASKVQGNQLYITEDHRQLSREVIPPLPMQGTEPF